MTVRVGVHPQRFLRVVAAVEPQLPTEAQHSAVDLLELASAAYRQVEVQLLGHVWVRPRGSRKVRYLLEGKARRAVSGAEVEPVPAGVIIGAGWRRLVARAVDQSE